MWCNKLVNFNLLSFCAACRTPSNPRDLGLNGLPSVCRLCVRSSSVCSAFSSVNLLPSTDSAGTGTLPLFTGFLGTMRLSDCRAACMLELWPRAFSNRSAFMEEADTTRLSWLPSGLFPTVLVVWDSVGFMSDLPIAFVMIVAFPPVRKRSASQKRSFSELNTQPGCTSVNASNWRSPHSSHHSRPK